MVWWYPNREPGYAWGIEVCSNNLDVEGKRQVGKMHPLRGGVLFPNEVGASNVGHMDNSGRRLDGEVYRFLD